MAVDLALWYQCWLGRRAYYSFFSCYRSSASPNFRLDEEDEEEENEDEDQGIIQDVVASAASSHARRRSRPPGETGGEAPPPILVTERASDTRTRTRVLETLTIETQPTVKFPSINN